MREFVTSFIASGGSPPTSQWHVLRSPKRRVYADRLKNFLLEALNVNELDTVLEACAGLSEIDPSQFARRHIPSTEDDAIDSFAAKLLKVPEERRTEAIDVVREADLGSTLEVYAHRTAKRAETEDEERRRILLRNGFAALRMTDSRESLLTHQSLSETCKRLGINPRKLLQ